MLGSGSQRCTIIAVIVHHMLWKFLTPEFESSAATPHIADPTVGNADQPERDGCSLKDVGAAFEMSGQRSGAISVDGAELVEAIST